MTDSAKIIVTTGTPQLETWVASYTSSEPLRKAIIKRTLLIAAFDERFVDKSINDADLRELLDLVAREMLAEPPLPLTAGNDDQATIAAE